MLTLTRSISTSRALVSPFVRRRYLSTSSVYSWGTGNDGQLGVYFVQGGKTTSFSVPTPQNVVGLNGKNVVDVSCGINHSAAVTESGQVYTWGKNNYGQLGLGDDVDGESMMIFPELVEGLKGVKITSVSCGHFHTAALSDDGHVFTWGWGGSWMNGAGALGQGDKKSRSEPQLVEALVDDGVVVKEIDCGKAHMLARSEDGTVWSWGKGEYGRLGNGGSSDQLLPEPVDLLLDIGACTQLACGSSFSLALMEDGKIFAWGRNEQGQLGIGGSMSMDVYAMEDFPVEIEGDLNGKEVLSVSAGFGQALATTADGELYQWGMGQWLAPRLVLFEDGKPRVVDADCGEKFNVAVTDDGEVYSWGKGFFQKAALGHDNQKTQKFPARIGGIQENVAGVSCGQKHTIVVTK